MEDNKIKMFISKELSKLEFKKYTKGFKYLSEAILICIKDSNSLDNICKYVYPQIALKYHEKSYLHIKWCIE